MRKDVESHGVFSRWLSHSRPLLVIKLYTPTRLGVPEPEATLDEFLPSWLFRGCLPFPMEALEGLMVSADIMSSSVAALDRPPFSSTSSG